MKGNKLPQWVLFLIFLFVFQISGQWMLPPVLSWLRILGFNGFSLFVTRFLLQLVLVYETIGKLFILQSVQPPRFEPTRVENWPHVNLDALAYYTHELQQAGFTCLGDYTAPTIKGMMRLFAHPKQACFAEVGQLVGHQIFCSISSELEGDWVMAVSNVDLTPAARSVSHAFMRLPRKIVRLRLKAAPAVLLESLLDWRSQVTKDLSIQPLQDVSAEMFFAQSRHRFQKIRHRLWRSSMVWRQLEAFLYQLNPKTEWLGDYPKLKPQKG